MFLLSFLLIHFFPILLLKFLFQIFDLLPFFLSFWFHFLFYFLLILFFFSGLKIGKRFLKNDFLLFCWPFLLFLKFIISSFPSELKLIGPFNYCSISNSFLFSVSFNDKKRIYLYFSLLFGESPIIENG